MKELDDLITYWLASYQVNYLERQPSTNIRILATINYLKELRDIKARVI